MSVPELHAISDHCAIMHCAIHDADERDNDDTFCVCFECNHVYQTERELVDTYNETGFQLVEELTDHGWEPVQFSPVDDAEQIFFCPLCTHDL